jgi:hypothetical protein
MFTLIDKDTQSEVQRNYKVSHIAAFHEAGHVIAALAYHIPFDFVILRNSAVWSDHYEGMVACSDTRSIARSSLIPMIYAGPVAEVYVTTGSVYTPFSAGASGDLQAIAALANDMRPHSLNHLRNVARQMVIDRWKEIRTIATYLLAADYHLLTQEQVRRILTDPAFALKTSE